MEPLPLLERKCIKQKVTTSEDEQFIHIFGEAGALTNTVLIKKWSGRRLNIVEMKQIR